MLPTIQQERDTTMVLDLANYTLSDLNHNMTHVVLPVTLFIGFECVVGLIGNVLILFVYSLRHERSNFRCFVLSMAVVDLTSCLTTLPGEIFSQMNWYTYDYGWICKVKSYFNVLTAWASASILLALAFDRYRKICLPLSWQLRHSVALKLCIASVVVAAVIASPVTILWGKQDYTYENGDIKLNVSICEKSSKYADDIYPLLYITCVYIFPIGVMMLVVCSLNVLTARTLFCGIDKMSRGLYKEASVSTLQSVISTVSLGSMYNRSCDKTPPESTLNVRCTNIDIWIKTSSYKQKHKSNKPVVVESVKLDVNIEHDTDDYTSSRENSRDKGRKPECSFDSAANDTESAHEEIKFSDLSSPSGSLKRFKAFTGSRRKRLDHPEQRRKRKTLIMLVLTSVFVVTMLMYVIMVAIVADTEGTLQDLSNSEKVVFFFFWRLYFINCVVNPILYGFMDPRFRSGLLYFFKRRNTHVRYQT